MINLKTITEKDILNDICRIKQILNKSTNKDYQVLLLSTLLTEYQNK